MRQHAEEVGQLQDEVWQQILVVVHIGSQQHLMKPRAWSCGACSHDADLQSFRQTSLSSEVKRHRQLPMGSLPNLRALAFREGLQWKRCVPGAVHRRLCQRDIPQQVLHCCIQASADGAGPACCLFVRRIQCAKDSQAQLPAVQASCLEFPDASSERKGQKPLPVRRKRWRRCDGAMWLELQIGSVRQKYEQQHPKR